MAEVHVKTLRRAADIVGGEQELALRLKVTPSHLALWLKGFADPPLDIFLCAVDLVLDKSFPDMAAARTPAANDGATGTSNTSK